MGSEGCPRIKGEGRFTRAAGAVLGGSISKDLRGEMVCCRPGMNPSSVQLSMSHSPVLGSSSPAFLEPPCPHFHPRPLPPQQWSPSQPRTDGQEQTAPGRSHLERGTWSPLQQGGKCGCSLSKAARKRKALLILFLERPQTVSKERNDFASQMPTKSLSCHLLCSG